MVDKWLDHLDAIWSSSQTIYCWQTKWEDGLPKLLSKRANTLGPRAQYLLMTRCEETVDDDPFALASTSSRRGNLVPTTVTVFSSLPLATPRSRVAPKISDFEPLQPEEAVLAARQALAVPGVWHSPSGTRAWRLRAAQSAAGQRPDVAVLGPLAKGRHLTDLVACISEFTKKEYGVSTDVPVVDVTLDSSGIDVLVAKLATAGYRKGVLAWS